MKIHFNNKMDKWIRNTPDDDDDDRVCNYMYMNVRWWCGAVI